MKHQVPEPHEHHDRRWEKHCDDFIGGTDISSTDMLSKEDCYQDCENSLECSHYTWRRSESVKISLFILNCFQKVRPFYIQKYFRHMWNNLAFRAVDLKNVIKIDPCNPYHQHFTSNFYLCRSQKHKKTMMPWLSFCALGIFACESYL